MPHFKKFCAVLTVALLGLTVFQLSQPSEPATQAVPPTTTTTIALSTAPQVDDRELMREVQARSREAQAEAKRAADEAAWFAAVAEAEARAAQEAEEAAAREAQARAAQEAEEARRATTTTSPAPVAQAAPAPGSNYQRFVRLADCESGEWRSDGSIVEGSANWAANTGNGYYGGLQFLPDTWRRAGGTGLPHQHSADTQIAIAESWLAKTSWSQWPACSRKLGYR